VLSLQTPPLTVTFVRVVRGDTGWPKIMPRGIPDRYGNTDKTIQSIRTVGAPIPNHRTLRIGRYRQWQAAVAAAQCVNVNETYTLYLTKPN